MARQRKKQRKKGRVRMLLLFLATPLVVWFLAFLIWFYWYDLSRLFTGDQPRRIIPSPAKPIDKSERRQRAPAPRPQEKIFDEDREKLQDILKRRN